MLRPEEEPHPVGHRTGQGGFAGCGKDLSWQMTIEGQTFGWVAAPPSDSGRFWPFACRGRPTMPWVGP